MKLRFRGSEILGVAAAAAVVGQICNDWIAAASIGVLWLGFKLLVTGDRIPVLFLAFTFQWMQVTVGMFYEGFLGRQVPTVYLSDYRPMVLIGLGCVLSIAVGVHVGIRWIRGLRLKSDGEERPEEFLTMPVLIGAYATAVVCEASLLQLSGIYPSLRQIFLTMTVVRMGLLFLLMRRLCQPTFRWVPFTALLGFEVALGFTGFFAGFREPLALGVMALLEIFNHRKTSHLLSLAGLLAVMVAASVMWMGVRDNFRRDFKEIDAFSTSQGARMDRISSLGSGFFQSDFADMVSTLDNLVDRMWVVYYPALAIARVPSILPHTEGTILSAAVTHVLTPRVFFPNKPELPSDSEMVRKYSGIYVAGRETGTSIAFGYAAEMYIDFGIPWMFAPVFVFGLLMGGLYAWFVRTISHREMAVSVVTVTFWLGLYLFERSTANMLGFALSLIVYLGVPAVLLDKFLMMKFRASRVSHLPYTVPDVTDSLHVIDHLH